MAKSDFKCSICKEVVSKGFFSIGVFKKYRCPNCGTICKDHVSSHLFGGPTCNKCGKRVIAYQFVNNRWKQV